MKDILAEAREALGMFYKTDDRGYLDAVSRFLLMVDLPSLSNRCPHCQGFLTVAYDLAKDK